MGEERTKPEEDDDDDIYERSPSNVMDCINNFVQMLLDPLLRPEPVGNKYLDARKINRRKCRSLFYKQFKKATDEGDKPVKKAEPVLSYYLCAADLRLLIKRRKLAILDSTHGIISIGEMFQYVDGRYPEVYALRQLQKVVPHFFELVDRFTDGEPVQHTQFRRRADKLYKIKDHQMNNKMKKRMFDRAEEPTPPPPPKIPRAPRQVAEKKNKSKITKPKKVAPKKTAAKKVTLKKAVTKKAVPKKAEQQPQNSSAGQKKLGLKTTVRKSGCSCHFC